MCTRVHIDVWYMCKILGSRESQDLTGPVSATLRKIKPYKVESDGTLGTAETECHGNHFFLPEEWTWFMKSQ